MAANRADEFREHWRALAGCTLAASVGTIGLQAYTSGAFVAALTGEGIYTRTQISFATFLLSALVAVAAPFAGVAMDRVGALRIITLSIFGEAAAFALIGIAPARFPIFVGAFALLALLGIGTTPPGFARIITARFDRGRGLALGVMISGLGLMAISGPIWANWVISREGWRAGYLVAAGLVLILGGIGTRLVRAEDVSRRTIEAQARRDTGGDWSALRRPLFWAIFVAFMSAALFGGGYLLHLITLLRERGFSTADAALIQSMIGVAVLAGRLGSGFALDRFKPQHVAAVAFTLSAAGSALLLTSSPLLDGLAALLMGLTIGSELDIMAYMISRHFGLMSFGRLYGLAYGGMVTAGGVSPLMISLIERSHGYGPALVVSTVGLLAGAALLLTLPSPPQLELSKA